MKARVRKNNNEKKLTADLLLAAAEMEFEEFGFSGTHTNQIANRAGFAPQTFYRHFSDKLEIFFAVYEGWLQKEIELLDRSSDVDEIADTILAHHNKYRIFRRDLRRLTVENEAVAAMRAKSRQGYLNKFAELNPALESVPKTQQVATMLMIERFADALADGEFKLLGVSRKDARDFVAKGLRIMLKEPRTPSVVSLNDSSSRN